MFMNDGSNTKVIILIFYLKQRCYIKKCTI